MRKSNRKRDYPKARRITKSRTMERTTETTSEPRQPRRLEKNKNTVCMFPLTHHPNRHRRLSQSVDHDVVVE